MNINNLNSALAPNNSSPGRSVVSNGNTAADQRNMFMTLLVTQLKNQDPLAPQDGTQFVAQLAQFNSLDQLTGIRQSIEQLLALSRRPTSADPSLASLTQIK